LLFPQKQNEFLGVKRYEVKISYLLLPKLNEGVAAALAVAVAAPSGLLNWKPLRVGVEVVVAEAEVVARAPNDAVDADVDSWNPLVAAVLVAVVAASDEGLGELKLKLGTLAARLLGASVLGAWLVATEKVTFGTSGEVETTGA
jgi:hypothetical protein